MAGEGPGDAAAAWRVRGGGGETLIPSACLAPQGVLQCLSLGGSYGLFARMTTFRWELAFFGARDAAGPWREYRFAYKPGDVAVAPRMACPGHLPRLDWRLWFVPLAIERGNLSVPGWLRSFVGRLLEGSPAVRSLLQSDPFEGGPPPRFVKACVFDYRFSSSDGGGKLGGETSARGNRPWWRRKLVQRWHDEGDWVWMFSSDKLKK